MVLLVTSTTLTTTSIQLFSTSTTHPLHLKEADLDLDPTRRRTSDQIWSEKTKMAEPKIDLDLP